MSTAIQGMRIAGIAGYAPPDVWSNVRVAARLRLERMRLRARTLAETGNDITADQQRLFQTSDRWVRRFIGFSERRFSAPGDGTIDLATGAAQLLFDRLKVDRGSVDAIIFASVTPSYLYSPPDAALLQSRLGIPVSNGGIPTEMKGADVSLACSSWVTSLMLTYSMIRSGMAKRVLLVGADRMSATINWRDRGFATVLGDAGTAALCEAVPEAEDWFAPAQFWSWLDGNRADVILTPAGGSKHFAPTAAELDAGDHRLKMDGAAVRETLVPFLGGPALTAALTKSGWRIGDLELVAMHEANLMLNGAIISMWRERGFTGEVVNAEGRYGNTTSASIPLVLALNAAKFAVGRKFGLFGFGGGLSASLAFGQVRHAMPGWINAE